MKKIFLSIAVLVAISTTSCKKAYECSCETKYSYSYNALVNEPVWTSNAASLNADAQANPDQNTYMTTAMVDKTSKASANATCVDTESTNRSNYQQDSGDQDGDGNSYETAIEQVETAKTDCSLKKK